MRWRFAFALATALVFTGCAADGFTRPEERASTAVVKEPGLLLTPRRHQLGLNLSDLNTCVVQREQRDSRGNALGWRIDRRERVAVTYKGTVGAPTRYGIWQFDANGRQVTDVECVLRQGDIARSFMERYLESTPNLVASLGPRSPMATSIGVGTTCYWADSMSSTNFDIICGGEYCFALMSIRADSDLPAVRIPTGQVPHAPTSNSVVMAWECTGGGGISMSSDGTVTYHTPGGGGDGGGGAGSGCGGTGSGGGGGDDNDDGTVDPPGGGGAATLRSLVNSCTDTIAPMPEYPICPGSNPDCLDPLTGADSAKVLEAFTKVNTNVAICKQALDRAREVFSLGRLFRGDETIPDDPARPEHDAHDAGSRIGPPPTIHIDGDKLSNESASFIAQLLLHEAWHVLDLWPHHGIDEAPPYTTYPWSQQLSCVLP